MFGPFSDVERRTRRERERRLHYLDGAIYLSIPRTLNNRYLDGDP